MSRVYTITSILSRVYLKRDIIVFNYIYFTLIIIITKFKLTAGLFDRGPRFSIKLEFQQHHWLPSSVDETSQT